jgi:putative transposase
MGANRSSGKTCIEREFALLAYVFMPDHLHLVVEGATTESCFPPFMTLFLRRTALWTKRVARLRLWQDGYYERVLRPNDDVTEVIAYILQNPIRKGLVSRPGDYPFLSPRDSIVID